MFVLTCPHCQHQMKMKRARLGATATCIGCQNQFKVDEASMKEERPAEEAPAFNPIPTAAPASDAPPVIGGGRIGALSEPPVEPEHEPEAPDLAAIAQVAAASSEAERTAEVVAEIEAEFAADTRKGRFGGRGRRGSRRSGSKLTVPALLSAIVLTGFLLWMMGGDDSEDTDDGLKPPVAIDPPDRPEGPDKPTVPNVPESTPSMHLMEVAGSDDDWEQFASPVSPIRTARDPDVLQWTYVLQHDRNNRRAMILAQFLSDNPRVYRSATLQVQLLNAEGRAYAQLERRLPIVCARQGMTVRVMVPVKLLGSYVSMVAQLIPHQPISDAVALEFDAESLRLVRGGGTKPTVELALRSTEPGQTVYDPELVVELLGRDGWLRHIWQGRLKGRIEPGSPFVFQMTPEVGTDPGRLVVRGYGRRGG